MFGQMSHQWAPFTLSKCEALGARKGLLSVDLVHITESYRL